MTIERIRQVFDTNINQVTEEDYRIRPEGTSLSLVQADSYEGLGAGEPLLALDVDPNKTYIARFRYEVVEAREQDRYWLPTVQTRDWVGDISSPTGFRLIDVELPGQLIEAPLTDSLLSQATPQLQQLGSETWLNARQSFLDTVDFYRSIREQLAESEFLRQEADRRLAFLREQAAATRSLADANAVLEQSIIDANATFRNLEADYQAQYELQVAAINAQYEQSVAFVEAQNAEIDAFNRNAELYNSVLNGVPLTAEQQSELIAAVESNPEVFSPANGFLSSDQLRAAITDPTLLTGSVEAANGIGSFSLTETAQGLLPPDPSQAVSFLSGLSRTEALEKYTFVCTCADFTGRFYNSETGIASAWNVNNPPALYGQQVCKHVLAVWNQLGYVTAADIPSDSYPL